MRKRAIKKAINCFIYFQVYELTIICQYYVFIYKPVECQVNAITNGETIQIDYYYADGLTNSSEAKDETVSFAHTYYYTSLFNITALVHGINMGTSKVINGNLLTSFKTF